MEKIGNCRGRRGAKGQSSGKIQCVANKKQSGYDNLANLEEEMERNRKVLKLVTDLKLSMTQINGQRRLGPPADWKGPSPGAGCEVFVGKIPRTLYEHDIYPVFRSVGEVFEIRLMMDFSGTNRGYCFVMYTKPEYAARAVKELDQFEIQPGKKIGVVVSINNCRLYIGQLPTDMKSEAIIKRIYEMTDEVENVAVYRHANGRTSYALVSYKTHRGAAMARRRLLPETRTLLPGSEVTVEWAHPNMFPVNVYEDCGTYDKEGRLEIKRIFVRPADWGKKNSSASRKKENRASLANVANGRKSLSPIGPPKAERGRERERERERDPAPAAGHELVPSFVGGNAIPNSVCANGYCVVGEVAQHRNTLELISENYKYETNRVCSYMEVLLRQHQELRELQELQVQHHRHQKQGCLQEENGKVSVCQSASFEFVNGYLPRFSHADATLQEFRNAPLNRPFLCDQAATSRDFSNYCEILRPNTIDTCSCCVPQRQTSDFAFGNARVIPRTNCQVERAKPIAKPITNQALKPTRRFNAFPQTPLAPSNFAASNYPENPNLQIPLKYCRPILCRSSDD